MIYQFKVQLKYMSPPVWRRLQVDSHMTFHQFHQVLQAAFEWEDRHLHAFNMLKANGRKSRHVEIGAIQEESDFFGGYTLDEKQEILADWFTVEKDKALYTYDFGDDWEHEIALEKILKPEKGVQYPRCVKAVQLAPEEDSMGMEEEREEVDTKILTAEVNKALAPLVQEVQSDNADSDIWQRLLVKSKELNALKPWETLGDNEIFVVVDPVSGEHLFVSVLGWAGEEFGLAVYIGDEGFESLQLTIKQQTPLMDIVFNQRSLLLSFVDREELEKDDYDFLKSHNVAFRGRKQWPEFRSMVLGSYPWSIDEEEARLLVLAIEQTRYMLQLAKQRQVFPFFLEDGELFVRIPYTTDKGLQWKDELLSVETIKNDRKKAPATARKVSEMDILRASKKPVLNSPIEFDLFYINFPVQPHEGDRPYFPRMAAVENAQRDLLNFIKEIDKKPSELRLKNETHELLKPILPHLTLKVKEAKKLPELENFKVVLSQMRQ